MSVFETTSPFPLQMYWSSSGSLRIILLYLFSSCIFYFGQKNPISIGTSRSTGENLPNFSCLFPNHKSVFLQIFHDTEVSWKITALYFLRPNIIYFVRKAPTKVHISRLLSARIKFNQIRDIYETTNWLFFKFCITLNEKIATLMRDGFL